MQKIAKRAAAFAICAVATLSSLTMFSTPAYADTGAGVSAGLSADVSADVSVSAQVSVDLEVHLMTSLDVAL